MTTTAIVATAAEKVSIRTGKIFFQQDSFLNKKESCSAAQTMPPSFSFARKGGIIFSPCLTAYSSSVL
jgi:hypothetical protein